MHQEVNGHGQVLHRVNQERASNPDGPQPRLHPQDALRLLNPRLSLHHRGLHQRRRSFLPHQKEKPPVRKRGQILRSSNNPWPRVHPLQKCDIQGSQAREYPSRQEWKYQDGRLWYMQSARPSIVANKVYDWNCIVPCS